MVDHTERDAAVARVMKKIQGRLAQKAGEAFEQVVCLRLIGLGFNQVERQATPTAFNRKLKRVIRLRKVSGDIKAIDPRTGRQVFVECKNYPDGLEFRRIKRHQVANLDQCVANRGIAILAWATPGGAELLDWERLRAAGFKPRTSVTAAMVAAALYRYR